MLVFTPRELQMIRLLVERGMSTDEAAWELHISSKTAAVHRTNIMRKLRTRLRRDHFRPIGPVDLVLYAIANGLVDMAVIQSKYSKTVVAIPSLS